MYINNLKGIAFFYWTTSMGRDSIKHQRRSTTNKYGKKKKKPEFREKWLKICN